MIKVEKINEKLNKIIVTNDKGMYVSFLNLGATIDQIKIPDKNGKVESVVMHPLNLNEYIGNTAYYGKTIGRVAGRIDGGKYTIGGNNYQLDLNDSNHNCLHGGYNGCSEKYWDFNLIEKSNENIVVFSICACDDGFNGNLEIKVEYVVKNDRNILEINYYSEASEDGLCNLTNHTYFNLSGNGKENILNHFLKIKAGRYTKLNEYLITTSIEKVNEVMDFSKAKKIGTHIFDSSLKEHKAFGYDHAFLFDDHHLLDSKIELYEEKSGRKLSIFTSYPCVVVYTCNYPGGEIVQDEHRIGLHDSVCLECQFIPNSINMKEYMNDGLLKKGEKYFQKIVYQFDIIDEL